MPTFSNKTDVEEKSDFLSKSFQLLTPRIDFTVVNDSSESNSGLVFARFALSLFLFLSISINKQWFANLLLDYSKLFELGGV